MDKNEVIILSSDEEGDFTVKNDWIPFKQARQELNKNSPTVKPLDSFKKVTLNQNIIVINIHKNKRGEPVGVVECIEESFRSNSLQITASTENSQNHSKPNIMDVEVDQSISETKKFSMAGKSDKIVTESATGNIEPGTKNVNNEVVRGTPTSDIKSREEFQKKVSNANVDSNQNLKFFTEFVEYCGSLEEVESDRAKLTKKLMKHYGEADCHYINSKEFRSLIQKFRDKVVKDNLYLTAKEVTGELIYRKKIEINTGNKTKTCQRTEEDNKELESIIRVDENKKTGNKKQAKVVKKIIKKLDKLGLKIQELEEKEVDLSDEEDSAYVQLQRYRERFYQIYTKLCKFTSNVSDLDRIYNRRICFTESKYPEINKCIENWLNKTKRFPDFSDIMKLLESQSSSLNLPSNRDAIRAIAIEIFQKVGSMLQRKRKYDLWDSFCGYLGSEEDPASKDVLLDGILKKNFDIRVKKEQEIFQHYAELQEKQRLEPEEIPDEEANRSPVESGNEDDEEIQSIEEQMNRRLDGVLKEDTEGNDESLGKNDSKRAIQDLEGEAAEQTSKEDSTQSKESKNNYKNCKSLKWRMESRSKERRESFNSEESNVEKEYETERGENSEKELTKEMVEEAYSRKDGTDDSDLELIAVRSVESDTTSGIYNQIKADTKIIFETPKRPTSQLDQRIIPEKRMRLTFEEDDGFEVFEIDDENEIPGKKVNEVFDVHYCQIFSDTLLDDLDHRQRKWSKRKVFRDLTNINRLMELQGKRRKAPGLFSSFFHPGFCEFEKSSWKKKFRESFRSIGSRNQKCALNQEEKSGKTVNSDSRGDSDEKNIQNNSEGRGDEEGNNLFSGHGNGSGGDNNEDENKKNGRPDIEQNETQREDDEEEEEDENNTESTEHSLPNQKTEKQLENKTPSKSAKKSNRKIIQDPGMSSKTPSEEQKEKSKVDTENSECILPVPDESENVEPESEDKAKDAVTKDEEAAEAEEKELEEANSSNEVTVVEKPNEDVDVIPVPNPPNQISEVENGNKLLPPKEIPKYGIKRRNSCAKVVETRNRNKASAIPKEYESVRTGKTKHFFPTNRPATTWKPSTMNSSPQNLRKRNTPSTSDEEIVKRFLLHSPSSISITPPRKLTVSKSPSQAALQALATLRNLKGISATIVRGKPKDSAIEDSYSRRSDQNSQTIPKGRRSDFPVISNTQTVTPKIVNVSGNVSGFDNSWPGMSNATCDSSPIRISNVWGSLPNNFMQSMMNETVMPGCSSQKSSPSPSNTVKKKNTKKNVEYVVLE